MFRLAKLIKYSQTFLLVGEDLDLVADFGRHDVEFLCSLMIYIQIFTILLLTMILTGAATRQFNQLSGSYLLFST